MDARKWMPPDGISDVFIRAADGQSSMDGQSGNSVIFLQIYSTIDLYIL